jgi:NAD(P)H-hydrate epimerase
MQKGEPSALAAVWPQSSDEWGGALNDWADAVLIGPGRGRSDSRALVESILQAYRGPVVLDADAINAFEGDAAALAPLIGHRQALLTPHPLEYSRLTGSPRRAPVPIDAQIEAAGATGATILLKGTPTTLTTGDGRVVYVAEGTPILATGGSGDVLGGIAATLLAQNGDALTAGALAAFAHGRAAASLVVNQVRGYTIEDVIDALPRIWSVEPTPPRPPVLAELRAVWDTP